MAIIPGVGASSMHGALVPIAYTTGNGTSPVVSFSNIPQGYQDLMIVVNGLSTGSSTQPAITFNGTSTGYSQTNLYGNGSSAASDRRTSQSQVAISDYNNINSTYPSSWTMHILNYANTSTYKTILWRWAGDANGSGYTMLSVGLDQTTSAISSMTFSTTNGGQYWTTSTTFELFGVRTVNQ